LQPVISTLRVAGYSLLVAMTKVLVFGTFDGLHEGHLDLLSQAKKHGDNLIVVVARDSTVLKNKGKAPKFKEQERLAKVQENKLVAEAVLGTENHDTHQDSYDIIKEINPDIVCLGYDQAQFAEKLKGELVRMGLDKAQIVILRPFHPEKYKSSIMNK